MLALVICKLSVLQDPKFMFVYVFLLFKVSYCICDIFFSYCRYRGVHYS